MATIEPPNVVRSGEIADVCTQLGVPPKDWHSFEGWAGRSLNPKELDAMYGYVDVMIAMRCHRPGGDLLSKLIEPLVRLSVPASTSILPLSVKATLIWVVPVPVDFFSVPALVKVLLPVSLDQLRLFCTSKTASPICTSRRCSYSTVRHRPTRTCWR